MDPVRFDLMWRYWLATAVPLTVGVFGSPAGVGTAIGITFVQAVHFGLRDGRDRRAGSLTVQVRWLYLLALLLGLAPPLRALIVLALIGVWANIVFGYCLAARMLSLAPWNRRAPLTARLVASTFTSPPTMGSIADRGARPPAPHARVASRRGRDRTEGRA